MVPGGSIPEYQLLVPDRKGRHDRHKSLRIYVRPVKIIAIIGAALRGGRSAVL